MEDTEITIREGVPEGSVHHMEAQTPKIKGTGRIIGGNMVNRDALDNFAMPEDTRSYKVVPHFQLAKTMVQMSGDLLKGFEYLSENYVVAKEGKQLFGMINFRDRNREDAGISVAFRNSYDKSMSIGIALGTQVFVCENLCLSGEITIMRKHTKNVWDNLEQQVIGALYKYRSTYDDAQADIDRMKTIDITDHEAYSRMGVAFGEGIVGPRQLQVVKNEWQKPSFDDFQPRTMWSLYNDFTYALKNDPPVSIMESHKQLHQFMLQ